MRTVSATVIIPCYNHAEYLGECLQSVVNQTVDDWEAIVVDDASTEGDVSAIVQSYHDQRIRLIRHSHNRGLAASRNTGVRDARSRVIVPLDADDKLPPAYLEIVLQSLSDQSVGFVYFDVQCFGDSSTVWSSRPFDPAAVAREHQFILAQAPIRKEVWEKTGGWCEDPVFRIGYEDTEFLLSVVRHGFRGIYIPQPLYQYRRTCSTLSARPRTFVLPIYRRIYERNKDLILRHSSYSEWMALGWLEVAEAYRNLQKPFRSLGCAAWAWIICKYRRPRAARTIRSSLGILRGRALRFKKPERGQMPTAN